MNHRCLRDGSKVAALAGMLLGAIGCGGGATAEPPRLKQAPGLAAKAEAAKQASVPKATESSQKWSMTTGGVLRVSRPSSERVEVTDSSGAVFAATRSGSSLTLEANGTTVATGELKPEKAQLEDSSGGFYVLVKNRSEKLKVYLDHPEGKPWEFKRRTSKIKIVKDEVEKGKVKFYPDSAKTKVKDTKEAVVLEIKNSGGLRVAPGLALVGVSGEIDDTKRNVLIALVTLIES